MEKIGVCKGGCGNKATYKGWCGIKWKKGNKVCVRCPETEKKRSSAISKYRIEEAKLGLNPMQNSEICKKNHSDIRNKKASESLTRLGKLKLLPQQIESQELKDKRLNKIREKLRELGSKGMLNHQIEPQWKKDLRHKRISENFKLKIERGEYKLPMPVKVKYKSHTLRSGWGFEVAKFLDENGINWQYEKITIPYLSPIKNTICYTIPDFFIPEYNLFIEVKSDWKVVMEKSIPKIEGVRKAGYDIFMWSNKEISMIRKKEYAPLLEQINNIKSKNA